MLEEHEMDFASIDYAALSFAQRDVVKRRAMARAHAERSQALRDSLAVLGALLGRIGERAHAAFVEWRKTHRRRRVVAAAIAELQALDDFMLKDMGISRGEIITVVRAGGRETAPPRGITAKVARAG